MGYQAVLFCPDERLARVVSQIFNEVDFAVDLVTDPFTTVKKLMAQHYDAIVVDCENEQNSSLLFKSAHSSSFNQNSLAIALVEGQAGVARAYRIGANLVLTKPINVEQTKGTLRVARGLLRKNAEGTGAARSTGSVPAASNWPKAEAAEMAGSSAEPVAPQAPTLIPPFPAGAPEFTVPLSAVSASATTLCSVSASAKTEMPALQMPAARTEGPAAVESVAEAMAAASEKIASDQVAETELPKPAVASAPTLNRVSTWQAAAAAPAKQIAKQGETRNGARDGVLDQPEQTEEVESIGPEQGIASRATISAGPTFAAFEQRDADGSGGGKKILIVVAAILALAVAGYFGWNKLGGSPANPGPRPSMNAPSPPPQGFPKAEAVPKAPSPAGKASRESASANSPATTTSPSPTGQPSPASERIALGSTAAQGPEAVPIRVKPSASTHRTEVDDAAAQPPSLVAVDSPGNASLSGLLASEASAARPSLAQIKISQGVLQGLLIKRVQPRYPPNALASHAQGTVEIEATIDREGNVVHPKVLRGDPALAAAALEAVRQWRYKPYYLNGEPVEIETQITIKFKGN